MTKLTLSPSVSPPRPQQIGEEILNAVSHGVGALLAIAATCVLVYRAALWGRAVNVASVAVFGGTMILLYLISCLYHALRPNYGKGVFQILDHCSIFLLIVGSYTPVCLVSVGGRKGLVLFLVLALCGVLGIVLNCVDFQRWKRFSLILYVIMGWMGVLALPTIFRVFDLWGILCMFLGGLLYTVGILFYRKKEKRYWHGIWHFFVLAGSVFHFCMIYSNCCI